jgi:hypothetical protein
MRNQFATDYHFVFRRVFSAFLSLGLWLMGCFWGVAAEAHMLNTTRMVVYFSEDRHFAADVYVDLAPMGIEYGEYFELTQMEAGAQEEALAPLLDRIQRNLIFQFDGWPVSATWSDYELPEGNLAFFLDEFQPKMTRVRLVGSAGADSVVFSFATMGNASFEFPLVARIEMPGRDLPVSALLGERGENSVAMVLEFEVDRGDREDDIWYDFVVSFGEGVLHFGANSVPHQLEILLVVWGFFFLLRSRRIAEGTLVLRLIGLGAFVLGLMAPVVLPVAWWGQASPLAASGAVLVLAYILLRRPSRGCFWWAVTATGSLAGMGVWQMVPEAGVSSAGFDWGYGVAGLVLVVVGGAGWATLVLGVVGRVMGQDWLTRKEPLRLYAMFAACVSGAWLGLAVVRLLTGSIE